MKHLYSNLCYEISRFTFMISLYTTEMLVDYTILGKRLNNKATLLWFPPFCMLQIKTY